MELYIFDKTLNFLGVIDSFTSLRWVRRYCKSGDFELHCSLTTETRDLLKEDNVIYKRDDTEAVFIETVNIKQDTEGKETLAIKGKFLTSYFNRRIVWETQILKTTAELSMRTLVKNSCITPTNIGRKIPNLILGTLNNYIGNVDYQVSYANLADELENLSNISNLGHRLNFDSINRKLVFEVYKGLDRSVNQSINPIAIFSKEFDNILEQEYTKSLNNYRNLALVGGMGEGADRRLITVGNSIGLERYEVFIDQRNLSNVIDGVAMSDTDYNLLLAGKGNELLASTLEIQTFDSKVNLNSNLKYKVNYDLGDIVTIINKPWKITLDSRITEIEEIYEEAGQSINITFGNNIPTLIDKIKQIIK